MAVNSFRASLAAPSCPPGLSKAYHEDSKLAALAQEARQGLPRHPPPRPDLCDQQEKPALQSPPGLIPAGSIEARYPAPSQYISRLQRSTGTPGSAARIR